MQLFLGSYPGRLCYATVSKWWLTDVKADAVTDDSQKPSTNHTHCWTLRHRDVTQHRIPPHFSAPELSLYHVFIAIRIAPTCVASTEHATEAAKRINKSSVTHGKSERRDRSPGLVSRGVRILNIRSTFRPQFPLQSRRPVGRRNLPCLLFIFLILNDKICRFSGSK